MPDIFVIARSAATKQSPALSQLGIASLPPVARNDGGESNADA